MNGAPARLSRDVPTGDSRERLPCERRTDRGRLLAPPVGLDVLDGVVAAVRMSCSTGGVASKPEKHNGLRQVAGSRGIEALMSIPFIDSRRSSSAIPTPRAR